MLRLLAVSPLIDVDRSGESGSAKLSMFCKRFNFNFRLLKRTFFTDGFLRAVELALAPF